METPSPTTGTAAVIGGGISGLAASTALRRAGWSVSVYERSRFKNEVGAGITIPPNACVVLRHLGFDFERARPVANETTRMSLGNAPPGEYIKREFYFHKTRRENGNLDGMFGGDSDGEVPFESWMFHRVDLHRGLRELAEDPDEAGGKGKKVEMNLGFEVEKVDCEEGILTLAGGRTVKVDLVIIADGAHSNLLQYFAGHPIPVQPSGMSIYRWLVPMSDVLADPLISTNYDPVFPMGFVTFSDPEKHVLWVTYPCRGGTVLNNALIHDTQPDEGTNDSQWNLSVAKERVLRQLDRFDESRRRLLYLANEDGIKVHHMFTRPSLTSFVKGRTIVIGDAAHVMLPVHAAGAATAIESAAALEVLFKGVDGADGDLIRERLQVFDRLRIPRCNLAQIVSNAGGPWTGDPEVEKDVRRFYQGPLPPVGTLPWMKEFREVLFHHDPYRAVEKALEESKLPN